MAKRRNRKKVYRIRMYRGVKGGSNYYYHADVVETHWTRALKAAREDRVDNWRWVDSFDTASRDYLYFEFMGVVKWPRSDYSDEPWPFPVREVTTDEYFRYRRYREIPERFKRKRGRKLTFEKYEYGR